MSNDERTELVNLLCEYISQHIEPDKGRAELLPADKVEVIESLVREYSHRGGGCSSDV